MKKISLVLGLCLITSLAIGQAALHRQTFTPNEIMDSIYDEAGAKYALEDLQIDPPVGKQTIFQTSSVICDAGYFRLYFQPGAIPTAQQTILCQIFSDISCFINSPLSSPCHTTTNITTKVNVYIAAGATGGLLGSAGPLYIVPSHPSTPNPGILENVVWKTIISGTDPYVNVAVPLIQQNAFYHMIVNTNTTLTTWNYNVSSGTMATGQQDYYSVYLHEVVHGLGFTTLMAANGTGIWGPQDNYYSRFDQFLTDHNQTPLLNSSILYTGNPQNNINPAGPCLPTTNGPSGYANCGSSVLYVSAANSLTVPVYTPYCFEPGSSLCHFEDDCYPMTGTVYGANTYFVMSKASPGLIKRHLQEEEKKVLCDIGYAVKATYSSTAVGANYTYTSGACQGINVWGNNDGLLNNSYTYTMSATAPVTIFKNNLRVNDSPNTATVNNFTLAYTTPGMNINENSTSITLSMTPGSTFCGVAVFKYIPKDGAGNAGNMTYVFVYVDCGSCSPPNICDMIQNGGFEAGPAGCPNPLNPFNGGATGTLTPTCWQSFAVTPDLYSNSQCTNSNYLLNASNTPTNTYSGSPNHRCASVAAIVTTSLIPGDVDVMRNSLAQPLVPGVNYQLSFWAFNKSDINLSPPIPAPVVLSFASSQNALVAYGYTGVYPQGMNSFLSYTLPQTDGGVWHHYTIPFTFTNTTNTFDNYMYFGIDAFKTLPLVNAAGMGAIQYLTPIVLFDDITMTTQSVMPVFTPPPFICKGTILTNLNQYTNSGAGVSAVYSGVGVVNLGGGNWNIDPNQLPLGQQQYMISQTLPNGCTYTNTAITTIKQTTVSVTPQGPNFACINATQTSAVLNATGGPGTLTYSWLPANPNGNSNSSSFTASPVSTTIYTVTGFNGQCAGTKTIAVNVGTPVTFINPPAALCTGTKFSFLEDLLAIGSPTGGVWSASNMTLFVAGVNQTVLYVTPPVAVGIHTVTYTYTNTAGCSVSSQFTLGVGVTPTITATGSAPVVCLNFSQTSVTLSATNAGGAATYVWQPGNVTGQSVVVSPASSTSYTLTASNFGCTDGGIVNVAVTNQCCTAANTITSSILGNGNYSGQYAINQDIQINGAVVFAGELLLAPNVSITINPGSSLSSGTGGVHMQSCGNMWSGINVLRNAKLNLINNDVIEDAIIGVGVASSTNQSSTPSLSDAWLDHVTFNRNQTAIAVESYVQGYNGMPVSVQSCVFTSRNLNIPINSMAWPNATAGALLATQTPANPLGSPYYLLNYPVVNCKAPYANTISMTGISFKNSGYTLYPNTIIATYYGVSVGDAPSATTRNVFDNLFCGIYSMNSNIRSYNNVFQNTRSGFAGVPGYGIYSTIINSYGTNYDCALDLVPPSATSAYPNLFYDCQQGIFASNIKRLNVRFCTFKSTQSSATTPAVTNAGNMGIYTPGNQFRDFYIGYNTFYNINTCVSAAASAAVLSPGVTGQRWGSFIIEKNLFSPFAGNVTTQYISNAVVIESGFGTTAIPTTSYSTVAGIGLKINNNTMDRVWRGIYINGLNTNIVDKACLQNTITLVGDVNATNTQWGVRLNNVYKSTVKSNFIICYFGTYANFLSNGVYLSMNSTATVQCNTANYLQKGFQVAGANPGTFFRNNSMQNDVNGLALTNTGIMGPQGNFTNPADNRWLGSWTGAYKNTSIDASSIAYNSALANPATNPQNSLMWVRNQTGYYPTNNAGAINQSYAYSGALPFSNYQSAQFDCATGVYVTQPGGTTGNPPAHRQPVDEGVVQDSLGYSDDATAAINKANLFRMIAHDPTIKDSSKILQNFYDAELQTNRATFLELENLIDNNQITTTDARLLVNSLTAANPTELNQIRFYTLFLIYSENGTLDKDGLLALKGLATKCPFTDGAVIYQARSLYNLVAGDFIMYNDVACPDEMAEEQPEEERGARRAHTGSAALAGAVQKQSETEQVKLYPNPAQSEIVIVSPAEAGSYVLTIHDAQGKTVGSLPLTTTNYSVTVQLSLINGIYFVTLTDTNGHTTHKKLVIAK